MKVLTFLIFIFGAMPSIMMAQDSDYQIPTTLSVKDFQTAADKEFLEKFNEIQIPMLMGKVLRTEGKYILPWLRENTAEAHDYQVTLEVMRKGVLVTDKQFAWVKKEVDACAEILHLSAPPRVFITGPIDSMKATAVNFTEPVILLPSELIDKTHIEGLRFAIGRQMGHIMCDHVFYHTLFGGGLDSLEFVLGKWVSELIKAFLGKITDLIVVDWTLASEISADRAGLIACQNVQAAQQTLLNFRLAMTIDRIDLNIEDYLRQAETIAEQQAIALENLPESAQKGFERWRKSGQLAKAHPFVFQRVKALQAFWESDAYRKLFESQ